MKTKIFFTFILLIFASITFSQSKMDFQTQTGVVVEQGADICADEVIINGTFSGGGTICGGLPSVLYLTAFIQGFYRPDSNYMVSDTVSVFLRSSISPYPRIDSAISILDTLGEGIFIYFNATDGPNYYNGSNYYIEFRHRNSIETWSKYEVTFSSQTLAYDFTTGANNAFGNNQIQVDFSPGGGVFAIYSGDVNQDGVIDATDIAAIDNDAFNFVTGYVVTDVNGDNVVDGDDELIAGNNAFNFVTAITP